MCSERGECGAPKCEFGDPFFTPKSGFASFKSDSSGGIGRYNQSLRNAVSGLKSRARVAVGLGIAGDTALGRIELNLCNVIQSSSSDRTKAGVQFGLSQSFS